MKSARVSTSPSSSSSSSSSSSPLLPCARRHLTPKSLHLPLLPSPRRCEPLMDHRLCMHLSKMRCHERICHVTTSVAFSRRPAALTRFWRGSLLNSSVGLTCICNPASLSISPLPSSGYVFPRSFWPLFRGPRITPKSGFVPSPVLRYVPRCSRMAARSAEDMSFLASYRSSHSCAEAHQQMRNTSK